MVRDGLFLSPTMQCFCCQLTMTVIFLFVFVCIAHSNSNLSNQQLTRAYIQNRFKLGMDGDEAENGKACCV